MNTEIYDVAIIAAGSSGLTAAIHLSGENLKVLLLDGSQKPGAKILMSGGTRSNVTNVKVSERDFAGENTRFIRNVLRAFPNERTIQFFKDLGVELMLESDGKYFPSTNSAKTILEALLNKIKQSSVDLKTDSKVKNITHDGDLFLIKIRSGSFRSKNLILASGGKSYPETGSDGSGYEIARAFGHSLITPLPALTPLTTSDKDWKTISGVSLPAKLSLIINKKKQISFVGSLLFTHFGFSGPSVLNISRYWLRSPEAKVVVNFIPQNSEEVLRKSLSRAAEKNPHQKLTRYLRQYFPERLTRIIIKKSNIPEVQTLGQLKRESRNILIQNLTAYPLPVTGSLGFEKAEVTAGGINLDEIDYRTLESKKQPGLFFAGEILDADGHIGGFNFQWAWSSAYVASLGVKARLKTL